MAKLRAATVRAFMREHPAKAGWAAWRDPLASKGEMTPARALTPAISSGGRGLPGCKERLSPPPRQHLPMLSGKQQGRETQKHRRTRHTRWLRKGGMKAFD